MTLQVVPQQWLAHAHNGPRRGTKDQRRRADNLIGMKRFLRRLVQFRRQSWDERLRFSCFP